MSSKALVSRRRFVQMGAVSSAAFLDIQVHATERAAVAMQLGWIVDGMQIGQVVAKKLGFYDQEGIEFSLLPGGPNIDGVAIVAAGRGTLGQVSSSPPIMLAASQGIPITCFAVGLQQHPWVLCSFLKRPIRTPADLRGKRVGIQPTSIVLLKAMLLRNKIAEKDVEIIPVGNDLGPLLNGQVDALSTWQTSAVALRALGPDRVDLRLWDAGVRLYANCYYAPTQTLKTRADVLQRFLRATARGWSYVQANRDQSVDILVSEYPNMKKADEREALEVALRYSFNAETTANGWGQMDLKIWQEQISLFQELAQFQRGVPTLEQIASMDVLQSTREARLKFASGK